MTTYAYVRVFSFSAALVLVAAVVSQAQPHLPIDRWGEPDTVRLECPVLVDPIIPGDTFRVGIYVWNDERVDWLVIPISYHGAAGDYVECVSVDSTGGLFSPLQWATGSYYVSDPDNNQCCFSWANYNPDIIPYIPPTQGDKAILCASCVFKILPGAETDRIDIDTLLYPPIWNFAFNIDSSLGSAEDNFYAFQVRPVFADCGTEDIQLGGPAQLTLVAPDAAHLGEQLWVSITGLNTSFAVGSGVTTATWLHFAQSGTNVIADQVNVNSPSNLDAHFQIPDDASLGLYDVCTQVTAQSEVSSANAFEVYIDCGDVDHSGAVNMSDIVYLVGYIFGGQPEPLPDGVGNPDCSATINMSDVVFMIAYMFGYGPSPCDPSGDGTPDCGP